MSSRDIEGENPLYLPQAKVYDGACALGPCLLVAADPLPRETEIGIAITRARTARVRGPPRAGSAPRPAPGRDPNRHRHPPRGHGRLRGHDVAGPDEAPVARARRVALP